MEHILAGLKMAWIFQKPASAGRPSSEDHRSLSAVSPLLGEPCMGLAVVLLGLQHVAKILCGFAKIDSSLSGLIVLLSRLPVV